ncbi:MAG: hypothetical protein K2X93_00405 [Candidatus Obscuribacterales bacterium]|nr:hypothetical protein [Candidatus Obscuribacterales bacterium]
MPKLNWCELDFLECLEADPIVDDYGTSHYYELEQGDLRIQVTVWQYESVIQLSLLRASTNVTIFGFASFVRGNVRYINDKRGKYLEVYDCILAPSRFWYQDAGDLFDHKKFTHGLTIRLEVEPEIRIMLEPCRNSY